MLICPTYQKPSVEMKEMKNVKDELMKKQAEVEMEPNSDMTKTSTEKFDEADELLKKQTVVQIREDLNKT